MLAWRERHGRQDLPWQHPRTPYRVWVSEIMLQQTQVATVIDYFARFVAAFPDIPSLAAASEDAVLRHWTGLGYYARARNLRRAAGVVMARHAGELPVEQGALEALPGIGRSTAAAILALAHERRAAILDGNVKRVLARFHAVDGPIAERAVLKRLWSLAERHTPHEAVAAYTQAIMDLGATVCRRRRPECAACPVASRCRARAENRIADLPAPRVRRARPIRSVVFVLARDQRGRFWLERRPPSGIWGGLYAFPQLESGENVSDWCRLRLGAPSAAPDELAPLRHAFTHFELRIQPVLVDIVPAPTRIAESGDGRWHSIHDVAPFGLAAPVLKLLNRF